MSSIIGFAGKMSAGKDSCCNALVAISLVNVLHITPWAEVRESDGKIVWEYESPEPDHTGNIPIYREVFDIDSRDPELRSWMSQTIWPICRKFSLAEPLKEFCQHVFGINSNQLWGSNEEKNGKTHLLWENMPIECFENGTTKSGSKKYKRGNMSGRDILEVFGTQICRKIYDDVWANALINGIKSLAPEYALVSDIRFPNEVDAIKAAGGKVIRLTRTTEEAAKNNHISNTALDEANYDWSNFDYVLDNQDLSMKECHEKLIEKLVEWDFLKLEEVGV